MSFEIFNEHPIDMDQIRESFQKNDPRVIVGKVLEKFRILRKEIDKFIEKAKEEKRVELRKLKHKILEASESLDKREILEARMLLAAVAKSNELDPIFQLRIHQTLRMLDQLEDKIKRLELKEKDQFLA